jgi:ABC-type branched-subunit amino acid transport system permease subunit
VLIGVLENVVGYYFSPAYKEGVALMLFLVVILFRPEGLLGKARSGRYERGSLPMSRKHVLALVVALVAVAVLPNFLKSYGVYLMTLFCVYLMATLGLNLTVGYAGRCRSGRPRSSASAPITPRSC